MADERAGVDLGPAGEENWASLKSALEAESGFDLFFVISDNRFARDEIRRRVRETAKPPLIERIYEPPSGISRIAGDLVEIAETLGDRHAIWVEGRGPGPEIDAAWRKGLARLNERRNTVIRKCPHAVLIAGDRDFYALVSRRAPDFFSVRSRVDFFPDPPIDPAIRETRPSFGYAPLAHDLQPPSYYLELAAGLANNERTADLELHAKMLFQAARSHEMHGDWDEALRVLRNDVLPTFERLGDVRERAVTMGKIANIMQSRGELDEALRTLREDVLPAFERLGDVRSRAVTTGKIADILQSRGELDEALCIRREEELPVYERLGDVRSRAVTTGKIADIMQRKGLHDDAIAMRREECKTYEQLRDAVSHAQCQFEIATNMAERGRAEAAKEVLELALSAYAAFKRLGLKEWVEGIGGVLKEMGVPLDQIE
ncbi:MAG: hypothetical protein IT350_09265 [Deltaproteobacteria bacterium]|nr:hypothetical protein [Deltaproteobacteria bacterium]